MVLLLHIGRTQKMSKIIVPLPKKEKIDFYLENEVDGFMIGIEGFSENFNNYINNEEIEN